METTVTATEARTHFGEMMRRAVDHEETIIIERGGKPEVVLLSLARYQQWQQTQQSGHRWEKLDQIWSQIATETKGDPLTPPEDMIRQMREERDARLLTDLC
jgi:prevent-host-death family protein